jgi:hypothetical protein
MNNNLKSRTGRVLKVDPQPRGHPARGVTMHSLIAGRLGHISDGLGDFVVANVVVVDRVQFLTDSSVWFPSTLSDNDLISLGENPNRQDGSVLNTGQGFPLTIAKRHRWPYGNDARVRYLII